MIVVAVGLAILVAKFITLRAMMFRMLLCIAVWIYYLLLIPVALVLLRKIRTCRTMDL